MVKFDIFNGKANSFSQSHACTAYQSGNPTDVIIKSRAFSKTTGDTE
tara:strand:+ start:182 stop:322 length:141 start_codon:yes stop_codon:yes gene_type:complete